MAELVVFHTAGVEREYKFVFPSKLGSANQVIHMTAPTTQHKNNQKKNENARNNVIND